MASDPISPGGDASETLPLLDDSSSEPTRWKDAGNALSRRQLFILCYARLMESIGLFAVFPYLPQMVKRVGHIDDSNVGFYSGLIESIFCFVEILVLPLWSYLADHIGRKPALVCSLVGMAVSPVLFGLSTSIVEMIVFRCIGGVFSGAGLIIRTMIGEKTTAETQATAYSWFSMTDYLGAFIGVIIGGALANPAAQYPDLFGGVALFGTYPYALPGLFVGAINVTGAVMVVAFLDGTRGREVAISRTQESQSRGTGNAGDSGKWGAIRKTARTPGLFIALWVYGQVMVVLGSYIAVLPVALFTPVPLGGMGYMPSQMSLYMTVHTASQSLWLLIAFPRLQRRMGTKLVLQICSAGCPLLFACYIAMNALLREAISASTAGAWFWAVCFLATFVGPGVFMSIVAAQLVINNVSPDPRMLGTLNALALMLSGIIHSIAPGAATAVYAVGVRGQICSGYLGWLVFIPLCGGLNLAVRWLPDNVKM